MELLASGRDADVYALDDHRVLRRLRHGAVSVREVDIMRYVSQAGYPVPRVHDVDGTDVVMDRLHGPTMGEAMGDGGIAEHAKALADLHNRLHAMRPPNWLGDGAAILHMDLHPLNVILTETGPYVIDWCNARTGEPALDTADMVVLLASVSAAAVPVPGFAEVRNELITQFLRRVDHDPVPVLREAAQARLRDPNLSADEQVALRRVRDSGSI